MTGDATTTPIHRLGAYELRSQIGEGGMGVVYRALDADGLPVAVKVLRPHIAGDQEGRDRFAREVRAMRRVRGSFVAEVLDANVTAETPYVVTRYVDGPPLYQVVAEGGPLTERGLIRLAGGLAEALEAIHRAGVVHRDLKPGNVLMLHGQPVVIDFGIAQVADETRLTSTGMLVGTPGYLAPEVLEGRPATWASDVHSWAATIAYAATGRPPFGRGPFEAVAFRVVSGRADLDGVPPRLLPMLRMAMARAPGERPRPDDLVRLVGTPKGARILAAARPRPPVPPAVSPVLPLPGATRPFTAPPRPSPAPVDGTDAAGAAGIGAAGAGAAGAGAAGLAGAAGAAGAAGQGVSLADQARASMRSLLQRLLGEPPEGEGSGTPRAPQGQSPGTPAPHGQLAGAPIQHGQSAGAPTSHSQWTGAPVQNGQRPGAPVQHGPGQGQRSGAPGQMRGAPVPHGLRPGAPPQDGQMPGAPTSHGQRPWVPARFGRRPGGPGPQGRMPGAQPQQGQRPGVPARYGQQPVPQSGPRRGGPVVPAVSGAPADGKQRAPVDQRPAAWSPHLVRPRPLLSLLLLLIAAAAGAKAPFVALVALTLAFVVVRTVDRQGLLLRQRRDRRGRSASDLVVAVSALPWHAARSGLFTVLTVPIAAIGGVAVTVLVALFAPTELPATNTHVLGAMFVGTTALFSWWGLEGDGLRAGTRRVLGVVSRPRPVAIVAVLVLAVVALGIAMDALSGPVQWWPFQDDPRSLVGGVVSWLREHRFFL